MAIFVFANNVDTTLSNNLSSSATTMTLASSANLPTLTTGQVLSMTLNDAATRSFFEVVYVTAISGSSCTIVRGQEGTTPQSWLVGDHAYASASKGPLTTFVQASSSPNQQAGSINLAGNVTAAEFFGSGAGITAGTIPDSALVTPPITSVTASSPLASSGGYTPNISISSSPAFSGTVTAGSFSTPGGTTFLAATYLQVNGNIGNNYGTWFSGTTNLILTAPSTAGNVIFFNSAASTSNYGYFNSSGLTVNGDITASGGAAVNGNITANGVVTPEVSISSGNLIFNAGNSSASVVAINYNNGATGGFAVGDGSTGYYGTITSTGLHAGSSNYGLTSASVAGSITPGYSSAVGTSAIYSGTGTPAFSAPSGSLFLSYSGTGGGTVYWNSSSSGTSGGNWTPIALQEERYAIFTSSTTWTCPKGVTQVYAFVVGGGGGGDNTDTTFGGVGGQAYGYYNVSPGTSYTITVGTAGTGSTSGSGTSGNTSSFASFCSGTGGGGGTSIGDGTNGTGSGGNLRNGSGNIFLSNAFPEFIGYDVYGLYSRITTSPTAWSTTLTDSTPGQAVLVSPGAAGSEYGNGGVNGIVALFWIG